MNNKGNILIIILVIGIGIVVIAGAIMMFGNKSQNPTAASTSGDTYSIGDVNKDGEVNILDINMVKAQKGCTKSISCWDNVIGKTKAGDNPIYASDLDLSKDGIIDQKDADMIK